MLMKETRVRKPVRIAHMLTEMNYGGVEMVVMNYYRNIDHSRYQFDFFALEGSEIPQRKEIEQLGGRIFIVPKYTHLVSYIREVTRIFKENEYTIVHSHMNTLSVFPLYAAKKAGIPVRIAHSHSTAAKGERKKNIAKYILRPFSRCFPTHLCACSKIAGDWLFGRMAKYDIINNAIDLSQFIYSPTIRAEARRELNLEGKFVVGHIGRFCYQKNHDFLIDIFKEIHKERKDAVLIMVGEGELEQSIREKVNNLGLTECVKFLGVWKDTSKLYQAMDMFLFPSRYEGLGMALIEAQASDLKCFVSAAVPNEAEVLDTVKVMPPEADESEWADCIMKYKSFSKRIDRTKEMRIAGYDIVAESKKLADQYDQLLQTSM